MSYDFYIESNLNCVFIRHLGNFVPGDSGRVLDEVIDSSEYRRGMNFLRDVRKTIFSPEIDYRYIKNYQSGGSSEADKIGGAAKVAWVAGSREDYILVHQVSLTDRLRPGSFQRRPFRDIKKARKWLGIPEDYEIEFPDTD